MTLEEVLREESLKQGSSLEVTERCIRFATNLCIPRRSDKEEWLCRDLSFEEEELARAMFRGACRRTEGSPVTDWIIGNN